MLHHTRISTGCDDVTMLRLFFFHTPPKTYTCHNVTDNSRRTEQNFPTWICCAAELNGEHTVRVRAKRHDERRFAETSTTTRNITVDIIL